MPALLAEGEPHEAGCVMFSLLTDTGLGACLMILTVIVGIPAAYHFDKKKAAK